MKRVIGLIGLLALGLPGLLHAAEEAAYRLAAQDKIAVSVLRHEELSQQYTVPPDGMIDFPRVGRINALGKTTQEVADALREQLGKVLRDPEVTVSLLEARTRVAYVLGAVARPGQYPIAASTRVTELLAAAGDLAGDREGVIARLVRGTDVIPVPLEAVLAGRDGAVNFVIQEGDLLWIETAPKITVVVAGQVKSPGAVRLRVDATPADALAAAGDLTERSDRVRISLLRAGQTQALKWGDNATVLQEGDMILVEQEPLARIFVNGHVKNPGAYELPPGGGVLEAIALAGGVLDNPALGQVTVVRADGTQERLNLRAALVDGQVSENPKLAPGDQVIVPEANQRISVMGMVRNPGSFTFDDSRTLTVIDALGLAGGGEKRAKLSSTVVIRLVDNAPTRIPVDVNAILKGGKGEMNIPLRAGDIVFVPETNNPNWGSVLQSLYQIGILASVL